MPLEWEADLDDNSTEQHQLVAKHRFLRFGFRNTSVTGADDQEDMLCWSEWTDILKLYEHTSIKSGDIVWVSELFIPRSHTLQTSGFRIVVRCERLLQQFGQSVMLSIEPKYSLRNSLDYSLAFRPVGDEKSGGSQQLVRFAEPHSVNSVLGPFSTLSHDAIVVSTNSSQAETSPSSFDWTLPINLNKIGICNHMIQMRGLSCGAVFQQVTSKPNISPSVSSAPSQSACLIETTLIDQKMAPLVISFRSMNESDVLCVRFTLMRMDMRLLAVSPACELRGGRNRQSDMAVDPFALCGMVAPPPSLDLDGGSSPSRVLFALRTNGSAWSEDLPLVPRTRRVSLPSSEGDKRSHVCADVSIYGRSMILAVTPVTGENAVGSLPNAVVSYKNTSLHIDLHSLSLHAVDRWSDLMAVHVDDVSLRLLQEMKGSTERVTHAEYTSYLTIHSFQVDDLRANAEFPVIVVRRDAEDKGPVGKTMNGL